MQTETIVFGGGCFWCTEAIFTMLKGVRSVSPGYAGPNAPPGQAVTYQYVSTGKTPYIEVVKVDYDPDDIAFEELLRIFFATHDPTTPNQQGNDIGPQYNSAIFCTTPRQQEKAQHYVEALNKGNDVKAIVTQVLPLVQFYPAEEYHKNYYENNKSVGYCQLVIAPKVEKVEKKFKNLLK